MKSRLVILLIVFVIAFINAMDAHAQRFRLEEGDNSEIQVSFDAIRMGDKIQFVWNINTETNIQSYEIRRGVENGRYLNWESLTVVNVNRNRTGAYSFTDPEPPMGEMHYRLRLLAPDGSSVEYSPLFKWSAQRPPALNEVN